MKFIKPTTLNKILCKEEAICMRNSKLKQILVCFSRFNAFHLHATRFYAHAYKVLNPNLRRIFLVRMYTWKPKDVQEHMDMGGVTSYKDAEEHAEHCCLSCLHSQDSQNHD